MTEHHVEVVRLGPVSVHPNADRLELTTVHDAYPCIVMKGEWKEGDLAVYVPVDSVVPPTDEWAFLRPAGAVEWRDKDRRIKAKKLRGIFSMGIITKAPEGAVEGQDVAELLGITRYEPDQEKGPSVGGADADQSAKQFPWWKRLLIAVFLFFGIYKHVDAKRVGPLHGERAPKLRFLPGYYDLEPFRKYGRTWFQDGEELIITEKVHGQNASYVHDGKKLHLKSRTRWRKNDPTEPKNAWAKAAARFGLEEKLAAHPGIILYGEVYGNFPEMRYAASDEEPGFAAFDAFDSTTGKWMPWNEFRDFCFALGIPYVPVLGRLTWGDGAFEALFPYAEGKTQILGASHIREGFVVKPVSGRTQNGGQRIILKMHGEGFLTRKEPS